MRFAAYVLLFTLAAASEVLIDSPEACLTEQPDGAVVSDALLQSTAARRKQRVAVRTDVSFTMPAEGLLADLRGDLGANDTAWHNQVPGGPDASVPAWVTYDTTENAYVLGHYNVGISLPVKTNPDAMAAVSMGGWFKLLESNRRGYVLSQTPDYGWSRAVTLSDSRLGGVSITPGRWDSGFGSAPVGQWVHVVGVWSGNGDTCSVYMNGQKASKTCNNGHGSNPEEKLMIGARQANDWSHNSWSKVAEVFVYDRVLTDEEVATLYNNGIRRSEPVAEVQVTPVPTPAPTFAPQPSTEAPTPAPWVSAPTPAPGPEPERSDSEDARFLMQASFGPTRDSLQALKGMSYADWIQQQMSLPVESHREYYRQRANNRVLPEYPNVAPQRSPCAKGSRFRNFAFAFIDKYKGFEVRNSEKIFVDGVFRCDIEHGILPSSWSGMGNFTGHICYVDEEVGGDVLISTDAACRQRWGTLPNPKAWLASGSVDALAEGLVLENAVKPGVLLLREAVEPCSFSAGSFGIQLHGEIYLHENRAELSYNTPQVPSTVSCIAQTVINERSCWLRAPDSAVTEVAGLEVEVHGGMTPVSEREEGEVPLAWLVEPQVHHPNSASRWPDFPRTEWFAARWTGSLNIQQGGTYELFLSCDDGCTLTINNELVVDNGGNHGWREREGSMALDSGKHPLVVEYWQGGGHHGLSMSWRGPDSGDDKRLVPRSAFSTTAGSGTGDCACGSEGEVPNNASMGHHLPFFVSGRGDSYDQDYDDRYVDRFNPKLGKSIVWTMKALKAQDQLRQRTAWALSQIIVVSTQGIGFDSYTEMWLSLYDIFVRNAFGNYRDVLKEFAFNPLMGRYLTHTGSSSYDYNGRYPNENFGREIMQLFTIGLEKMHPDGSKIVDAQGQDIATYTNDQILNFARVLTGFVQQARRNNVEHTLGYNFIDAMSIDPKMHDQYPKPDLDGNFLGDGYPLCSAGAGNGAFLRKGAVYKLRGFKDIHNALTIESGSALYTALCQGSEERCIFPKVHELSETLQCSGGECEAGEVQFVRVGGADFEFLPPPCVQLFFSDSQVASNGTISEVPQPGQCVDANGGHIHHERSLGTIAGTQWEIRDECIRRCRAAGARGCELRGSHCVMQTRPGAVAGNGAHNHLCFPFAEPVLPYSYVLLPKNTGGCPEPARIDTMAECERALLSLGLQPGSPWISTNHRNVPRGCSYSSTMHWNSNAAETTGMGHLAPICRAHITLARDGAVTHSEGNVKYQVPWVSGTPPAAGLYLVRVETHPVFDRVPSKAELQQRLKIGAAPPTGQCSACDGPVKAYGSEEGVGPNTVFELDGAYFSNAESFVHLPGGAAFRNAPVFMDPIQFLLSPSSETSEQAALAEVECLLDHLFHHSNTPVFVGRRLIQRFVTSNPSPSYVEAVSKAFSTGSYSGKRYSGKYGDLAATVAAVLLHPEARTREEAGATSTSKGALREPLLKFIHLMRAMEYRDKQREQVVFSQLQDVIGQFPFQSPTVFNYYLADYELPMPEMKTSEPEPEPEPESESEAESEAMMNSAPKKSLVGPEFQILTPPYLVGYLNSMSNLINTGVSYDCSPGVSVGVRVNPPEKGVHRNICPQGELMWQGPSNGTKLAEELDVMLTGGRFSPAAKAVVQRAYDAALPGEELQAAQTAAIMTAEFNTLGETLPQAQPRPVPPATAPSSRRSYKAVVMLFLAGGADTWNMLVPREPALYQEYRDVRTDLALNEHEIIDITTEGQAHHTFGMHGSFRYLKQLYDAQEAAFISNVGNLAEPTTMETWRNGRAQRCQGLYSHSDQQNAAQTLKCQEMGTAARGVGGRLADALADEPHKYSTSSFSLAGSAVWPHGVSTQREIVDERGTAGFYAYEGWRDPIVNITSQRHGNVYAEAYTQALLDSVKTTEALSTTLHSVVLATNYALNSRLQRQLHQVARLIRARAGRGAERDFFFVSTGGWDMHSDMKEGLAARFGEIDTALRGFVEEMKAQGIWDDVVLVTESEFGRTLDSNGGGSDHAWAGNHFIVGGPVAGQRVFNQYPASLRAGNDWDLGRGRLIPEYPWESMMVPIAKWLGLSGEQVAAAFPNLNRFNATKHIIDALFKV